MATIKSYTDISQSRKLAEILPIESADMRYAHFGDTHPWFWDNNLLEAGATPCWSLAALLGALPSDIRRHEKTMFLTLEKAGAYNLYYKSKDRLDELWETDFEPINACYKMILNLHEEKLL